MKNILVCIKQVPDTTEIRIDPVKKTLIREGVPSIVNPFDAYALELAARIKDKEPGTKITLVSMGPPQAENALRECLAVGGDKAYLVSGREFGGSDTLATSYILSCAIKKLEELEYYINVEELDKIDAVTKAHIALDAVNNPKNREKLLSEFGHIPSKGEFIETIMNENCPAYVKKKSVTPKEAAEIIRAANGKVILAHPVAYVHEDNFTDEDIIEIINDMKPDGIESNYLYVDRFDKKINETKKWNQFAKEHDLFVTVGSDFHNKDGIRPEIGFTNTDFLLSEDTIEEIIENLEK